MPKISELPSDNAPAAADIFPFLDVTASTTDATTVTGLAASPAFVDRYVPQTETQAGTVGAPTPTTLLQFQPVDTNRPPFELRIGGASFNSVWNPVALFGWNASDAPGVEYSRLVFEENYEVSVGTTWQETYFEFGNAASTSSTRPIFIAVDKDTLETYTNFNTVGALGFVSFQFDDVQKIKLTPTTMQFPEAYTLSWVFAGAKTLITAFNGAGNQSHEIMRYTAADSLVIGDGNNTRTQNIQTWTNANFEVIVGAAATRRIQANATGLGFFAATPVARPTGVAVTAAGVHAALVSLGLIAA